MIGPFEVNNLKSRRSFILSRFERFAILFSMAMFVAMHFACTRPKSQFVVTPPFRETSEQIRARTEAVFERAIFYKPREDSMSGLEMTFAPLIVQEVDVPDAQAPDADRGQADPSPFGAIVGEGDDALLDSSRPTVYAGTFAKGDMGNHHDQVVYFWRYPACSEVRRNGSGDRRNLSIEGRGVRITLGSDGFPLVWEALSTATDTRILFVSESLEAAAQREFGSPLPGRRYAVERSLEETPNIVVARVLDDGPVPMGPYVYLNASPQRTVTTILCRCMSSQVNEFAETRYYDLVPLEAINDFSDTRKGSGFDRPPPRVHWGGTLSSSELEFRQWNKTQTEELLRWPKGL